MPSKSPAWAYLLLTIAVLMWSGNFILGRAVHAEIPPIGLAFWRWVVAAALLAPFAVPAAFRQRAALRAHWRLLLVLALFGVAAFNTLVYVGLQTTTAVNGALVNATMPALIVITGLLLFRDAVSLAQTIGIALSFCGVAAIIFRADITLVQALQFTAGDLIVLAATACYAVYVVLWARRPPTLDPYGTLLVLFLLGAAILAPFYAWESLVAGRTVPLTWTAAGAVFYVAAGASVLAWICYNRGIELVGPGQAGMFINLNPVFASILAVILLGEPFRLYHAAGMALVFAGIWLATRAGRER